MIVFPFLLFWVVAQCQGHDDGNSSSAAEPQTRQGNPCNCYFKESCGCTCSRPISWSQFQVLPQNFRPCPGFTLALRGGQFHSFPSDFFYRVGNVEDFVLDVADVAFEYLNDPNGESSPYNGVTFDITAYIRMFKVTISRKWNWGAMYWLAPTSRNAYCEVQVVQSTVPVIERDFGRICQGAVTVADVTSSGVAAIEDRAFAPFKKLIEVDLSNNRIELIRRSYFAYPANSLEYINLENNNIRRLPDDMFYQMPSLENVNLRGNPIATLDEQTFRPIFRTVHIQGLETFPLTCDCNSRWLKEPSNQLGPNMDSLVDTICDGPSVFKGYSFVNDTQQEDLVC